MSLEGVIDVAEQKRLNEARETGIPGEEWGPYLSERQWGTVREDYSREGNAWACFSHDQFRSRAYRWGEDGIAGISDDKQRLCFALALWNKRDPFLKERLFGSVSRCHLDHPFSFWVGHQEYVSLAVYLASDEHYLVGQTISPNGGMVL